jgi:hypothetical protein
MIEKYIPYIIIGLLLVIMGQGFLNVNDHNYELYDERIKLYRKKNIEDLKKIDSLNTKLNTFKDEVHKIDSITSNYSNTQIDSFYTNFFR